MPRATPTALREQVLVNFAAPVVLTRHALPYLIESRGAVINIGSGITAVANSMLGVYGATKAGLAYWNDALRRELRHRGVSVSLVDSARSRPSSSRPSAAAPTTTRAVPSASIRPPTASTTRCATARRRA